MGTGPAPPPVEMRHPSNLVPAVITLVAVLLALLAGFLVWFSISGWSGSLLPDAYNAMYIYATKGSTSLSTYSPLGALLVKESTANPIVLFAFAVVLFFWPAMVVSGVYSVLARSFGPYPFIWGLVAFIFAYVMMYYGGDSLGIGAYLALVAAVLFLVGAATVRRPRPVPTATPSSSTPAPVPPTEPTASTPPEAPPSTGA